MEKTKEKGEITNMYIHNRNVFCYWDGDKERFIPIAIQDNDDGENIKISVGEYIAHNDKQAGIKASTHGQTKFGLITRLFTPWDNQSRQWLAELDGAGRLQLFFMSSSLKKTIE